jgi:predicted DNA-binding transcriptional regulator AlpA
MSAVSTGLIDPILDTKTVKRDVGNISEMCLWRWRRDRGFPAPDLIIGGRKFWHRSSVEAWIEGQKEATRAAPKRSRVGRTRADVAPVPTALSATPAD